MIYYRKYRYVEYIGGYKKYKNMYLCLNLYVF